MSWNDIKMLDTVVKYPLESHETELISASIAYFLNNSKGMGVDRTSILHLLKSRFDQHKSIVKGENAFKGKATSIDVLKGKIKSELISKLFVIKAEQKYLSEENLNSDTILCDDFKIEFGTKNQFTISKRLKKKKYEILADLKWKNIDQESIFTLNTEKEWVTDFYTAYNKILNQIDSAKRKEETVLTQLYDGLTTGY